ncbi:MAG: TolC family protein, partial [Rhodothermales bacterium]|nr:TolC family protein [Rhodothermales bacterium]
MRRAFGLPTLLLAGVLTLPLAGESRAQVAAINLDEAVELALSGRPELAGAAAFVDAERARRLLGLGLTGPTVAFSREGIATSSAPGSGFGEQKVGVLQEIPFPMALRGALRVGSASVGLAEANLTVLRAEIREAVRSAYVDALYAQELLALRERAVDLGTQLLESVEARIEVGEAAEIDLLKAQLQEAEARD